MKCSGDSTEATAPPRPVTQAEKIGNKPKTVALTMETDSRLWYNIMKKFEERLFFKEYQLK